MGKIIVTEFVSLDGVMEAPGPDGSGYPYAGWTFEFESGPKGDKFKVDEIMEAEAQLLGRITYEGFAKAWPSIENEFADKFNRMPKYVVSSTLEKAGWTNSAILKGDLATEVAKLKEQVKGAILVSGSARLVQGLIELNLVDELRLMVFPVILGTGKRLFAGTHDKKTFQLSRAETLGGGIELLIYRK